MFGAFPDLDTPSSKGKGRTQSSPLDSEDALHNPYHSAIEQSVLDLSKRCSKHGSPHDDCLVCVSNVKDFGLDRNEKSASLARWIPEYDPFRGKKVEASLWEVGCPFAGASSLRSAGALNKRNTNALTSEPTCTAGTLPDSEVPCDACYGFSPYKVDMSLCGVTKGKHKCALVSIGDYIRARDNGDKDVKIHPFKELGAKSPGPVGNDNKSLIGDLKSVGVTVKYWINGNNGATGWLTPGNEQKIQVIPHYDFPQLPAFRSDVSFIYPYQNLSLTKHEWLRTYGEQMPDLEAEMEKYAQKIANWKTKGKETLCPQGGNGSFLRVMHRLEHLWDDCKRIRSQLLAFLGPGERRLGGTEIQWKDGKKNGFVDPLTLVDKEDGKMKLPTCGGIKHDDIVSLMSHFARYCSKPTQR